YADVVVAEVHPDRGARRRGQPQQHGRAPAPGPLAAIAAVAVLDDEPAGLQVADQCGDRGAREPGELDEVRPARAALAPERVDHADTVGLAQGFERSGACLHLVDFFRSSSFLSTP